MIWDQKAIETLRSMAAEGLTARVISDALGCTRNAVIGKAKRTDTPLLGTNGKGGGWVKGQRRVRKSGNLQRVTRISPTFMLNAPAQRPHRERAVLLPEVIAVPCDIFKLNDDTCRWPLWGQHRPREVRDQLYCGDMPEPGSAWCKCHLAISVRQPIAQLSGTNYAGRKSALIT